MAIKLLVVEDNTDSRNLLHFYFSSKQFDVVTASDGNEGYYLAQVEKPNLIITDLNMPNGNGIQLIKRIREHPELSLIPILVYTAYRKRPSQREILEAGASQTFYKPEDFGNLLHYATAYFEQLTPGKRDFEGFT